MGDAARIEFTRAFCKAAMTPSHAAAFALVGWYLGNTPSVIYVTLLVSRYLGGGSEISEK
jgi:hypothetical protein